MGNASIAKGDEHHGTVIIYIKRHLLLVLPDDVHRDENDSEDQQSTDHYNSYQSRLVPICGGAGITNIRDVICYSETFTDYTLFAE